MKDDIYSEMAEGILEGALAWADTIEEALKEYWHGVPFGQKELTDLEFVMWYEKMMASNPNWQPATMYTPGGPQDLRRYLNARSRLMQQMMQPREEAML